MKARRPLKGIGIFMEQDMISIVVPVYRAEKYIEETIDCVRAQTYTDWELLLIEDCGPDQSRQRIEEYIQRTGDGRIRLLTHPTNLGAARARNLGVNEARGRYLAYLDADDLWVPEKLEEQLKFMVENGYDFTYTDYRIQLNGEWLPYICTGPNMVNKRKMYNYCYFSTITVIYRREAVGLIQIENLRKNNDYAMWLQAVEKVNCYRYPKCMSYYIKHDGSVSSGSKFKLIKWHYLLFRIGLYKNPFVSAMLTLNNLIHGVIKKMRYKESTTEIPEI